MLYNPDIDKRELKNIIRDIARSNNIKLENYDLIRSDYEGEPVWYIKANDGDDDTDSAIDEFYTILTKQQSNFKPCPCMQQPEMEDLINKLLDNGSGLHQYVDDDDCKQLLNLNDLVDDDPEEYIDEMFDVAEKIEQQIIARMLSKFQVINIILPD